MESLQPFERRCILQIALQNEVSMGERKELTIDMPDPIPLANDPSRTTFSNSSRGALSTGALPSPPKINASTHAFT